MVDMAKIIGYARTSTVEQVAGLQGQIRDLKAFDPDIQIFQEHVSSVAERVELDAALASLGRGDTLVVTKPDRLARSTLQLLSIVKQLDTNGASLLILSMGGQRIDSGSPTGKLMLTFLAGVAEFERDMMLSRQKEGIAKAKVDGKYRGRTAKVISFSDGLTAKEVAESHGVSLRTIQRRKAA
jgi:DNA invertase Pin-like site-specific DNA recombinase